jgi:hypothetical protein
MHDEEFASADIKVLRPFTRIAPRIQASTSYQNSSSHASIRVLVYIFAIYREVLSFLVNHLAGSPASRYSTYTRPSPTVVVALEPETRTQLPHNSTLQRLFTRGLRDTPLSTNHTAFPAKFPLEPNPAHLPCSLI